MVQEEFFNDISYLELWWLFCSAERSHLWNFGFRDLCGIFLRNYFEFGPVVQEKLSFKIISYKELL